MSAIFTAGDGGYASFRIPALAKTPSGVLVAFCEARWAASDAGDINIACRRSTDGGATWSPTQIVLSQGSDTVSNPAVVVDPASGHLVLLSCRSGGADTWDKIASGAAPARRVYVQRSTDAVTWSAPVEITAQVRASGWRWYATGPGAGAAFTTGPHTGRLIVPANHTKAPTGSDTGTETKYAGAHDLYSDDGGVTWHIGFESSTPNGVINEGESSVTLLPDGQTLYFSCRCEADGSPGNRADAYSADGGLTLTTSYRPQCSITTPICQGSLLTLPDGRLLYAGPEGADRAAMALRTSTDGGVTWWTAHKVSGLPAAYSSMVLVDGTTVGLLYETGNWSPYDRIEFVPIPISDLR